MSIKKKIILGISILLAVTASVATPHLTWKDGCRCQCTI